MKTLIGSESRILAGVVFLFLIFGISNSCSKSSMDNNMNGMGGNTGTKGTPGTNEVWIQGMAFTPSSITVQEGTTVTWTNKDAVAHTVTSLDNLFDSGSLSSGKTFTSTFSTAGTYQYKCSLHPGMTAKVIVTSEQVSRASVSIQNMAFVPETITVKTGTIITWTNNATEPHTVTSDASLFNSGSISNADGLYQEAGSFSHTFPVIGIYHYYCTYHPMMTGTVIVN